MLSPIKVIIKILNIFITKPKYVHGIIQHMKNKYEVLLQIVKPIYQKQKPRSLQKTHTPSKNTTWENKYDPNGPKIWHKAQ